MKRFMFGAKATTESQHRIDIRWMKKQNYLRTGIVGTLSWTCRGEESGSIGFRVEADRLVLNYRHRSNGGEWEGIEQIIYFDWTPCNYGGRRQWLLCPKCGNRFAILYGGKYYFCRNCHNLSYACQQETPPFRLTSKAQKIRERLGASRCTCDPIVDKPKGMHRKTFERLRNEAYQASEKAWRIMEQRFGELIF